jgi:branched-chain amino acid aminotransferase
VAMDRLRAAPPPGAPRHPAFARCYLASFAGPWVWVIPPEVQERGAHLMIARTPRIPASSVDPRVKNFHWADLTSALFEAHDRGADQTVLLDDEGNVTEGPGFNLFAVTAGSMVTPDRGVLEGITRRSVFELCEELAIPCEARPLPAAELLEADEIFLATTAGGIMPASRVDGRILGDDRPGPLSSRLRELYWAKRRQGWHATPVEYGPGRADQQEPSWEARR